MYHLSSERLIFQMRKAWLINYGTLDSGNLNEEGSNMNSHVLTNEGKLGLIKFTSNFNDVKK